jgi:hypothetical protein
MALIDQILEAQRLFINELLAKANVVGVGIGYREENGEATDQLSLVTLVEQKKPAAALDDADKIPEEMDGIRTDVREVGIITAQQVFPDTRRRRRPIQPGISSGHHLVTAGTIGAVVYDRTTGEAFLLSNNHVFANSNDALLGDAILQPGATDGGTAPQDQIGKLARYGKLIYVDDVDIGSTPIVGLPEHARQDDQPRPKPPPRDDDDTGPRPTPPESNNGCAQLLITLANALADANTTSTSPQSAPEAAAPARAFAESVDTASTTDVSAQVAAPTNAFDAALAQLANVEEVSPTILGLGTPISVRTPDVGMRVRKVGRTTGYTEGDVKVINTTVDVGYNTKIGRRTARFTGQIIATSMSKGGDSGSLVMHHDSLNAVGLLFAGSPSATVFTPLQSVLDALHVQLIPKRA